MNEILEKAKTWTLPPFDDKTIGLTKSLIEENNSDLVDSFYITPKYFEEDLNTHAGSGFGIQPIFRQSAYFRYSNKAPEFDNLYFVGASTHPGAGVPGVISTAKATEKLILKD